MVGPIPEGEYHLALRPNMPFAKTGGGWGDRRTQVGSLGWDFDSLSQSSR
jgi:hypothetical protein